MIRKILYIVAALVIVAVGGTLGVFYIDRESATIDVADGYGANPKLPKPNPTTFPTVNIAEAASWQDGETPTPAEGFVVKAFATGLDHPRTLLTLPNGDVLVTETNKPEKEETGFSLRGMIQSMIMANAGAEVKSANRISLLRDKDRDGKAEEVVHCLNVRRFPNIEQDVFSFLCQGHIHEMPSEYNAGHRWTEPASVVRIRHFAGDKYAKWSKSPEFEAWRRVPWDEALEMHAKAVAKNG